MSEPFDDQPQRYWAADSGRGSGGVDKFERADDRFVVACGQRELWDRVRSLIDRDCHCAWMPLVATQLIVSWSQRTV
jgi:hypothetical protein